MEYSQEVSVLLGELEGGVFVLFSGFVLFCLCFEWERKLGCLINHGKTWILLYSAEPQS